MKIIYLHGFRSSPRSAKAQLLAERFAAVKAAASAQTSSQSGVSIAELNALQFFSPQLPASPKLAIDSIVKNYAPGPKDCLIGSSLGGFYAAYLAQTFGTGCVLLNPAVNPARDLAPYVGRHKMFHSEEAFVFEADYLAQLRALEITNITVPERYMLVAAKGDELLDYREMLRRYPAATLKLLEQSDHGLSDFTDYIDEVVRFCLSFIAPRV
jgi:uncharacterized protein